jgi:hypothetical protein
VVAARRWPRLVRDPPPSPRQPPCCRTRPGASSRPAPPPPTAALQEAREETPRTDASSWHGYSTPRSALLLCPAVCACLAP